MRKLSILFAAMVCAISQPAMAEVCPRIAANDEVGRIKNVTASGVLVIRGGRNFTGVAGCQLKEGDKVTTARGARVGFVMSDDTRMALGPNSEIKFDQYTYDRTRQSGSALTTVTRGRLGVTSGGITRSGADRMRVRTPTSTLGVRGTTFVVEVKG